ncbi:OLC1v1031644C1 [Oldenlandia corymbosa var. corymbosa]|uniref:OLC1v1031644C1 n=1 Tax=Oldenlandia corymbosa var. corymbosa TaxID=529605 RepID=A0AAV1CJB7_OLDCO|nr:OLC1v1031644C1 [Oldenlandia corymbosa var. corymbosa]
MSQNDRQPSSSPPRRPRWRDDDDVPLSALRSQRKRGRRKLRVLAGVVLSYAAAGAKGAVQGQLLDFLKSKSIEELNSLSSQLFSSVLADGSSSGGPRLSFVNGAWIDQSLFFKPNFKKTSDEFYRACSTQVDFQNKPDEAGIEVNNWADNETNGLIKDLIPPGAVDQSTRLILANALEWQYISVYEGYRVLRLPYKQGKKQSRSFSMYVYLPDDPHNDLSDVVEKISSQPEFVNRHLPRKQVPVGDFLVPKFKVSYGIEASRILKSLGLILPFTSGFTDMGSEDVFVSQVFHKSFIKVNEKGME